MNRRELLRSVGLGALGVYVAPLCAAGSPASVPTAVVPLHDLASLASRLRAASRDDVLGVADRARRAGASASDLLGAVFLAGLHDIKPWHVGGKLHAVMMVESTFQLSEGQSEIDRWLAALWNLDDFKRSQARDIEDSGEDWRLPPRPEVVATTEAAARTEFLGAMNAWDPGRADRAIVALLPFHDRDSLFELVWPLAARSFVNIGHKIIYAAQIERTLRRIDWAYAEPALRSLVLGLLYQPSGRQTDAFARSDSIVDRMPETWLAGTESPAESLRLSRDLRTADREKAQDLVVEAFRDGLGPRTVWDGLRLRSAEVFLHRASSNPRNREALLPVHAVTVTAAFGHAWRVSQDDRTRRLMVLQAAAWLADLNDWLARQDCLGTAREPLEELGADTTTENRPLDALFEDPSAARARAVLRARPEWMADYVTRLHRNLIHTGLEHHQHKYAAAFAEEARLADPRWASLLLAPALPYLPAAPTPATDFTRRALATLAKGDIPL